MPKKFSYVGSKQLHAALALLSGMQAPSVEKILDNNGYPYEASIVGKVVAQFQAVAQKGGGK